MNDSPLPLYTQRSVSKFKAILLAVPEKLHRPLLVFITPLGNAVAINMMRMKSFHVYLTAPRRVASSVLTQHSVHVKDLTQHLVFLQVLLSVQELTVCMTGSSQDTMLCNSFCCQSKMEEKLYIKFKLQ